MTTPHPGSATEAQDLLLHPLDGLGDAGYQAPPELEPAWAKAVEASRAMEALGTRRGRLGDGPSREADPYGEATGTRIWKGK